MTLEPGVTSQKAGCERSPLLPVKPHNLSCHVTLGFDTLTANILHCVSKQFTPLNSL